MTIIAEGTTVPPQRHGSRSVLPGYWLRTLPVMVAAGLAAAPSSTPAQEPFASELSQRVETLRRGGMFAISGATVQRSNLLLELYDGAGLRPLWTDAEAAADLVRAIRAARADGLDPGDYHLAAIETLTAAHVDEGTRADLDLLRSDALLRLAHDLRHGKADQADPAAERNLSRLAIGADPAEALRRMIASGRLYNEIGALRPSHYVYRGLTAALAELRRIEEHGGWDSIAAGPSLRSGSAGPRVAALRRRLAQAGDLREPLGGAADLFDSTLEAAVEAFQHRHDLSEDGIVGPATLRELNVPVAGRIAEVRVNLERARWVTHDLPATFVAINIAGARVYLVQDGTVVHEARAIVGQTSTRTPVFQASMRQIELNPTWTVPPGIVGEVLAEIRRHPGYLGRVNLRVLDRNGRPVAISAAQLGRLSAQGFPYVFRQEPGPANPLGRIKFVFPNPYNVYLHDTPAKHLFEREQRTFSHGCIRIEDPFRLAELLLDDPTRWNRASLLAASAPGTTRTIPLQRSVPVLVLYWTASTDLHGELHFYRDVYGRDAAVLRALDR